MWGGTSIAVFSVLDYLIQGGTTPHTLWYTTHPMRQSGPGPGLVVGSRVQGRGCVVYGEAPHTLGV